MTYNPNYPTSLDALSNPSTTTNRNDPGFELHGVIGRLQDIAEALEAKVGIGASTPAAGVLRRTTGTTTAWGPIQQGDITAGQISQAWAAWPIPASTIGNSAVGPWYDIGGATLALTGLTAGSIVLYAYRMFVYHTIAFGRTSFRLARGDTGAALTPSTAYAGSPSANWELATSDAGYFLAPVNGSLTVKLQGNMIDAGATAINANTGALFCAELRR